MSKEITASHLKCLAEYSGLDCRSYSGRGMCGARCFAIVCSTPVTAVAELIAAAIQLFPGSCGERDDLEDYLLELTDVLSTQPCTDNMGYDTVMYWPWIEWPQDLDESSAEGSDE